MLTALFEDRLFVRNRDQQVVIGKSTGDGTPSVPLVDPLTLADAGTAALEELTRIETNNRLRRYLRITVARFALANDDPAVRLRAVKDIVRSLDATTIELLGQRAATETDPAVRHEIETGLALAALDGGDPAARLRAVETCRIG